MFHISTNKNDGGLLHDPWVCTIITMLVPNQSHAEPHFFDVREFAEHQSSLLLSVSKIPNNS